MRFFFFFLFSFLHLYTNAFMSHILIVLRILQLPSVNETILYIVFIDISLFVSHFPFVVAFA